MLNYDQNAGSEPYKVFVLWKKSNMWSRMQTHKYLWQRTVYDV